MGGRSLQHPSWFEDGIHPNDKGYAILAGVFAQAIKNLPKNPSPIRPEHLDIIIVGDSITEGVGAADDTHNYPAALGNLLGAQYSRIWPPSSSESSFSVTNLGNSGKTMMRSADFPYWNTPEFANLKISRPDIVFIMLGNNDGKNHNWFANSSEQYVQDYTDFIRTVQSLPSNPIFHLMIPPPLYIDDIFDMNQTLVNQCIHDMVPKIAESTRLSGKVVDIFNLLGG